LTDTKNCATIEMTVASTNAIKTAFLCFMIRDAIFIIFHPFLFLSEFHLIIILNTVLDIQQTVGYIMFSSQQKITLCWVTCNFFRKGSMIVNSKMDRRKKYTRMVLKESLMKLLQKKQISSITIKEICELADINRSTYYAHYSNQYELLNLIEEEFIEDLVATLSQYNFSKEKEALQMTEKLFEYIAENSDVCHILLSENSDIHFQKKGMKITQQFIFKNWITDKTLDKETYEYINLFLVSGSIYVIKNWLENGQNKTPKEMADILHNFINKGLSNMR
jgi:Transcriptional regulator C-terminal region